MFILIKSDNGILSGDNEVSVYDSFGEAFYAMFNQVQKELRDEHGTDIEYDSEGRPQFEDSDNEIYCLDGWHACVGPCNGPEWQIFKVEQNRR